jgi:hypothetical protein
MSRVGFATGIRIGPASGADARHNHPPARQCRNSGYSRSTMKALLDAQGGNMRVRTVFALTLAGLFGTSPVRAGEPARDSSWRNQAPKLYLQDETYSDVDYLKTEVTFVNYVGEPAEADIHLIVTSSLTGSGGQEYTLNFQGRGAYREIDFCLRHNTNADATPDEIRSALTAGIRRGLVPFIARTRLREYLAVEFTPPATAAAVTDPWRNWVFTLSASGFPQGEKEWSRLYYFLNADVSRVTDTARFNARAGISVDDNRYQIDSVTSMRAVKRNYYAVLDYGRKLSDHFSAGAVLNYVNNEYSNVRLGLSAGPKLEYCLTRYPDYARHKVYVEFSPTVL